MLDRLHEFEALDGPIGRAQPRGSVENRRSWPPPQAGSRRASRLDLDPSRALRRLWDDLHLLPVFSLPYTHFSLLARCQALWRRFVEHCPWEKALPKLKDPDRLPDPSTVRRWTSGLDSTQPALSFLSQTVARVAHWLARSHQADGEAGPLRRITPVLQNLWPLRL